MRTSSLQNDVGHFRADEQYFRQTLNYGARYKMINQLIKVIAKSNCVAFLGAGASFGAVSVSEQRPLRIRTSDSFEPNCKYRQS